MEKSFELMSYAERMHFGDSLIAGGALMMFSIILLTLFDDLARQMQDTIIGRLVTVMCIITFVGMFTGGGYIIYNTLS